MSEEESHSKAPLVVFGGILLIALSTMLAVVIGQCNRGDTPYLDSEEIKPGEPGRVYPTIDPNKTTTP